MTKKRKFETPSILRIVETAPETTILAGSIVDQIEIISAGQEVHDIDASSSEFEWNDKWEWEN
ncbi:MAG: hypothetical protein IJ161_10910 [Bacteroidales bacterium]|nr:hypothetical protein [Bacteroidales bacterium]